MDARIDSLLGMLSRGRDSAMLRFALGNEYLALDDHAGAIVHLRAAVDFDSGYSAAYKLLGRALAGDGQQAAAIATYEEGIRVAESSGDRQAAREMSVFVRRLRRGATG